MSEQVVDGTGVKFNPTTGVFLEYGDLGAGWTLLTVGKLRELLDQLDVPDDAVIAYGGCGSHSIIVAKQGREW